MNSIWNNSYQYTVSLRSLFSSTYDRTTSDSISESKIFAFYHDINIILIARNLILRKQTGKVSVLDRQIWGEEIYILSHVSIYTHTYIYTHAYIYTHIHIHVCQETIHSQENFTDTRTDQECHSIKPWEKLQVLKWDKETSTWTT